MPSSFIHLMLIKRNLLTRLIKLVNKLIPNNMEPVKFRITLCYLNRDMHIPNNKNIIFLLDSRKRRFRTSNNSSWDFSNRIDAMNLRLFPRKLSLLGKRLAAARVLGVSVARGVALLIRRYS